MQANAKKATKAYTKHFKSNKYPIILLVKKDMNKYVSHLFKSIICKAGALIDASDAFNAIYQGKTELLHEYILLLKDIHQVMDQHYEVEIGNSLKFFKDEVINAECDDSDLFREETILILVWQLLIYKIHT